MRAAVTEGVGSMVLLERPEPAPPGPAEVVIRPEAVGICGSDYHFFAGELSEAAGGGQFPRVQGHELAGAITALGPGCRAELTVGQQVAVWPLHPCGRCYPCGVGRLNTCDNFALTGIHLDGGLQERLAIGQDQVFPITAGDPAIAALAETVSIAVRAVNRAKVQPGERAVVLGAGPIGQCVSLDATGVAAATGAMVGMVASAGRAVQVGMSNEQVPIRVGVMTEKELDLLGVSCCVAEEFAEAVAVVERNGRPLARLISHQFGLNEAPAAIRFAMSNPAEVMKVVIRNT